MRSNAVRLAGLTVLSLFAAEGDAQQPSSPAQAAPAVGDLFGLGGMGQAAADLRQAGEAFQRMAGSLEGTVETIARSLAAMSSEFDPFGYKSAFRLIGQQTEIIERQHKIIYELQLQEARRLRDENRRLMQELQQRPRPSPAGKHRKRRKP